MATADSVMRTHSVHLLAQPDHHSSSDETEGSIGMATITNTPNLSERHHHEHHHKPHHQPHQHRLKGERKPYHNKHFKTPKEVMLAVIVAGINKTRFKWQKLAILGFLSGIYIAFGTAFALTVSLGVPEIRAANPGLARLLNGAVFPVALMLIIIAGGELFTGNTMFCIVAFIHKKVPLRGVLYNLSIVYVSNFIGAVVGAYFFGYLTQTFATEPYLSGIQAIAVAKVAPNWGVQLVRAIAANELVNLAIVFTLASEDIVSKIFGAWWPIMTFAVAGYEHCVANMVTCTLSLMYGADSTFWEFLWRNLIPVTIGNFFGGSCMVGGLYYYVYIYGEPGTELPTADIKPLSIDIKVDKNNKQ